MLNPDLMIKNGAFPSAKIGSLSIETRDDIALASVTARLGGDCALTDYLGFSLPSVGEYRQGQTFGAFWTGPDQWFIEAPYSSHADLATAVKTVLGDAASVTEQSDGWVRFVLDGPHLLHLMERLCALDLAKMSAGSASRCQMEHIGCFVLRQGGSDHISVLCPRSSAQSLYHALISGAHNLDAIMRSQ